MWGRREYSKDRRFALRLCGREIPGRMFCDSVFFRSWWPPRRRDRQGYLKTAPPGSRASKSSSRIAYALTARTATSEMRSSSNFVDLARTKRETTSAEAAIKRDAEAE